MISVLFNRLNSMWGVGLIMLLVILSSIYFTWQEIEEQSHIRNMNCIELQKWINDQNPSPDSAYDLAVHRFSWMGCEVHKI